MDKSWNHPWTTDEMRKNRREWSLAGDAGLLKHLQQFSENLMSKANKTQEALDTLTSQLNETSVLIDNITNTSLALANTQFIESRVQEDETEVLNVPQNVSQTKDSELVDVDLIASVSESVHRGLALMDEKYERLEVLDSDSEDENNEVVVSTILGPNNPYQHRPLPYVIGSDKWQMSNKIGLESSSSESEQVDEEDEEEEESEIERNSIAPPRMFNGSQTRIARLSSSSSDSEIYSNHSNSGPYSNNRKADGISENTLDSDSDSTTHVKNMPKIHDPTSRTPTFAEELSKRLGKVNVLVDESSEASINRLKDDIITESSEVDNKINVPKNDIFEEKKGFLDYRQSENLWKENPRPIFKSNIIPPSNDVPPSINIVSTKPKSAIDDLFGDGDSDDSDSIFAEKYEPQKRKSETPSNNPKIDDTEHRKTHLDPVASHLGIAATSTPDTNVNTNNSFSDEDDEKDLFGAPKKQLHKSVQPSPETKNINIKKPAGGVNIIQNVLKAEMESKLASRKQQMPYDSSNSSSYFDNNQQENNSATNSTLNTEKGDSFITGSNIVSNFNTVNETMSSSGISNLQPSFNNLGDSTTGPDFGPRITSSRLKSEEIFREQIGSDSLFNARSESTNSRNINNATSSTQPSSDNASNVTSSRTDDVFDNEDLFGPPPLSKSDSKVSKSKVQSLFDDSDSGDDLFSTTSSGSRSQKSTDFLTSALPDKNKTFNYKGLFDDDTDIFGSNDSPDVDIFNTASKASVPQKNNNIVAKDVSNILSQSSSSNVTSKKQFSSTTKVVSLFDDDEEIEDDLFGTSTFKNNYRTESPIFDTDNDLFSTNTKNNENPKSLATKLLETETDSVSSVLEKLDSVVEKDSINLLKNDDKTSKRRSNVLLFADDDDDDDLFGKKKTVENELTVDDKDGPSHSSKVTDVKPNISHKSSPNEKTTNIEDVSTATSNLHVRKLPPKSLDISPTITSSPEEETQSAPKKVMTNKIKNLMDKIGDLKILSPTDAPLILNKSEDRCESIDEAPTNENIDNSTEATTHKSNTSDAISPQSFSDETSPQVQSSTSIVSQDEISESAINFDQPVQVETLVTASKNRVRIQAKRRPQSRHARKSVILQNDIDYDAVDTSLSKDDRLTVQNQLGFEENRAECNLSITADDKSELGSISKESLMSSNKNTLLSPSTDEEDLFDVPPDLPEDPQKDDALFGRAPILSPVENIFSEQSKIFTLRDTLIEKNESDEEIPNKEVKRESSLDIDTKLSNTGKIAKHDSRNDDQTVSTTEKIVEPDVDEKQSEEKVIDPLRDENHDPLKDPSQLFAFVTKTPSPEKGKSLLFSEDDSLFSSDTVKKSTEKVSSIKKPVLDLFSDDADGDLFSTSVVKQVKKPLKESKIGLFDPDAESDEDESLFNFTTKKKIEKKENREVGSKSTVLKNDLFTDDNMDDPMLIFKKTSEAPKMNPDIPPKPDSPNKKISVKSNFDDIFGDETSEDDIFASRTLISRKIDKSKNKTSLFSSQDDDDDTFIFGKESSSASSSHKTEEHRPVIKKAVTRDLKKTAEKIEEDPLSLLRDS